MGHKGIFEAVLELFEFDWWKERGKIVKISILWLAQKSFMHGGSPLLIIEFLKRLVFADICLEWVEEGDMFV